MSHTPLRAEKDCLNCGTIVQGRYCHVCGQENVVPKEGFWHMVFHFFYDITHFDSKFFSTLKYLVSKPGLLSKEYMNGRRARYLHPVKMYVFTSAMFFLLFFSVFSPKPSFEKVPINEMSGKERLEEISKLEAEIIEDSSRKKDTGFERRMQKLQSMKDTTRPVTAQDVIDVTGGLMRINLSGESGKYSSFKQYDSVQNTLPADEKDGWLARRIVGKEISINKKYASNPSAAMEKLSENVLHRLPYMLIVSLPLFALILKLLYIRRRQFYYADHGIFTIHLYIFSFILLLVVFGLNELQESTRWEIVGYIMAALFVGLNFYLYKAMRVFYGQGRLKTFIKYVLTAIVSFIMVIILLVFFFLFSAIEL